MFILESSNNETDNSLSAAHFELGTGEECHGAVVIIGIENASTLTLPVPNATGMIEVSVKGLKIRRLDAIEFMGRRYTRSLSEPGAGEFYWNRDREALLLAADREVKQQRNSLRL